ncbi:hypothetical protein ACJJIF_06450 [Microbulbifer sp. SSSA002]|uniref:hypothetical protein n=1 Tax=Microbulbifer sp. SSSA002 TaxID=3243376 RepID=UPI00403960E9
MLFALLWVGVSSTSAAFAEVSEGSLSSNPFVCCAAVVDDDNPVNNFADSAMPQEIVDGIRKTASLSAGALEDWVALYGGRGMCLFYGANLPCAEKANTSRQPSSAMISFCKDNPDSEMIPAVVTGRASVYEWHCSQDSPAIVRQVSKPDARGYLSNDWYRLESPVSAE